MRKIIISAISGAAILAGVVLAAPYLVPASLIEQQLADAVRKATGRTLSTNGDARFSIFPTIGAEFGPVSLSGQEGSGDQPLMTAQGLTARLKFWPLLQRRFELDAVVLHRPVIDLRGNISGLAEMHKPEERRAEAPPDLAQPKSAPVAAQLAVLPAATLRAFGIAEIRFRRATVRFGDDAERDVIENANLSASLPDVTAPLTLSGRFDWRGERIDISSSLLSLPRLAAGEPSNLQFDISSAAGRVGFDGTVLFTRDKAQARGQLSADTQNLPLLMGWFGARMAPSITRASLDARLIGTDDGFTLDAANLGLDDMTAVAAFEGSLAGERPRIKGSLAFDMLDIEKFRLRATEQTADTAAIRPGLIALAHAQSADSTAARGEGERAEDLQIDLAMLMTVDADLAITAAAVSRKALSGENGDMRIQLQGGEFVARLARLDVYGGQAQGDMSMDNSAGVPVMSATFRLRDVAALPFLSATSSFDWLSGRLDADLTLASGGATVAHLRRMIRGEAVLELSDGAIEGMDLPDMLARAQDGDFSSLERQTSAQTQITELRAAWTIAEGVARTTDLRLRGPMIGADGKGELDLVGEKMEIRLQPRVTPRDGGEAKTVEIPIKVEGRWDSPKVLPDMALLLENPDRGVEAAKSFGRAVERFTGGRVSEDEFGRALDSLFGKPRRRDQDRPDKTDSDDAGTRLDDRGDAPGHRPYDAQQGY